MTKLKRIHILSFAKFQAIAVGLIGLLCGILYSFGGLFIDAMVTLGWLSPEAMETPGLSYGTVLAFGALIGMPLIGAAIGFAAGLLEAPLYNLFARRFGGIDVEVE